MPEEYAPREHPRFKEFKNKNPTREDVKVMLQAYDDRRIKALEARIWWLEQPIWRRAWERIKLWFDDEEEQDD